MKSAARVFYLSVFALWAPAAVQCQSNSQDACVISPKAIVNDACASYSTLERLNHRVKPVVDDLTRTTDFFSHYRLNLFHKSCPFWDDENSMCGNIACAVETLDDEADIPPVWRASELGKLEGPLAKHPGKVQQRDRPVRPLQGELGKGVGETCVVEYDDECDDRDYCVPEDEGASSKGDYVSLLRNPERFTGYAGDGAKQMWDAIYRENCFQKSSFPHAASLGSGSSQPKNPAARDFKAVMEEAGRQQVLEVKRQSNPLTPFVAKTGFENEDECLEKRVFYRVVSGMHASISSHICWDFLNQSTGQWQPNLGCYVNRLHKFPERISNLYFNYALLTRAVAKLGPYLAQSDGYTFCTGDEPQDAETRAKVQAVTAQAASVPQIFDESLMFKNGEGPSLKEDFRNRFRNVSRLMDCVGCDKCRLWGKLQTAGYGAALKVLFEFDNNAAVDPSTPLLKRTELVAMFNTYARLSSSLDAITKFRAMLEAKEAEADGFDQSPPQPEPTEFPNVISDRAKKPHNVVVPPPSENPPVDMDEDGEEMPQKPPTFMDQFNKEFGQVFKVVWFILKAWFKMPAMLWRILTIETKRVLQAYLGLPVSPRNWQFERPNLDEL